MKNCIHCGKPIVLRPSAAERAKRYGGRPEDYTALFDAHGDCIVRARSQAALDSVARHRAKHRKTVSA